MTTREKMANEIADIIEGNPDCLIEIDNDCWYISVIGSGEEKDEIAHSNSYPYQSKWYAHSSNYGAAIAEAMVILLNRRGFKIEAHAV